MNFLDTDLFFDYFREIAMATDFGQNLQNDLYSACNGHNFCYILCNFGEDRSTNSKDLAGS